MTQVARNLTDAGDGLLRGVQYLRRAIEAAIAVCPVASRPDDARPDTATPDPHARAW